MLDKKLLKFNRVLTLSIQEGEDYFYNQIIKQIKKEIKCNCYILKPESNKTLSIYPNDSENSLTHPLKIIEINRDLKYKTPPQIRHIVMNQIKENGEVAEPNNTDLGDLVNSKILLKTVKSLNNAISAVLIVERSQLEPDFTKEDEQLLDYFRDVLAMPASIFEADRKIKSLSKKYSTLNKLASYHFPNNKALLLSNNSSDRINIVYFVMDIRNSSGLNEYLVQKGGINGIVAFYKTFKEYCDSIGVKKYQSWFRKQIGDRMDYAWPRRDHKKAIFTAMDIINKIDYLRRKNNIPISIGLGVGISQGEVWPDYEINELKGDPPRIANELQEKNYGIYLDYKPHTKVIEQIEAKGWMVLEKSLVTRGKMRNVWEIRKRTRGKININQEDTIEQLRFNGRIYGDGHIHIEGADIKQIDFMELFEASAKLINRNPSLKQEIENITHRKFEELVDDFVGSVSNDEDVSSFSFQEFLTKMYSTKMVLSSNYKLAESYVEKTLRKYFNKFYSVRLGVTPSIPSDFPHLNSKRWNNSIYNAIATSLEKHKGRKLELVIETKRQHLDHKINDEWIYKRNINFLKDLYDQGNTNLSFSISVCDDASAYPLFNKSRLEQFCKYIDELKDYPDVNISLHMLEAAPDLNKVDPELKASVKENPLYELKTVLYELDKRSINGVNFVHMCNIFAGANPKKADRTDDDKAKIRNGMKYLERMMQRQDRIVVCYSSNKYLQNQFILEYPEILKLVINGKLNLIIGTDDPGPFKVYDVKDEMEKVKTHLSQLYPEGIRLSKDEVYEIEDLLILLDFACFRNSWRVWNAFEDKWQRMDLEYVEKVIGLDRPTFEKLMHYDICPHMSSLESATIKQKVIASEKRNSFGL